MTEIFEDIEAVFPKLSGTQYKKTSDSTNLYNCIAWAAGENDRWWQPGQPFDVGYYWPIEAKSGDDISCLISAYESIGYSICSDAALESNFEKIALYGLKDGRWAHAARQLSTGAWSSKIGPCEDIEHEQPEHLECDEYGTVHCYMKRPRP